MSLEWFVAGLLLVAALWPLVRKTRSWGARMGAFSLLLIVAVGLLPVILLVRLWRSDGWSSAADTFS